MAAPGLVLVHSPLLGAFSWRDVASRLGAEGYAVVVPDFAPVLREQSPFYPKIARAIANDAERLQGDVVLVGHSGAGALLPVIANRIGQRVRGLLFVDAMLPHPGKAWLDTVPPDFGTRVKASSTNGLLPPWHEWWPPQVMAGLLPDEVERERFFRTLNRQPLAYFAEVAPPVEPPLTARAAYLRLSAAYETEAEQAGALGWPVEYEPLGHLAMVTDAGALARHIQGRVARFGV
jgi:pimeloyl-ACP methyl ester carboxylesterase